MMTTPRSLAVVCAVVVGCTHLAHAEVWQPSPGHTQIPLWPGTPPDAQPTPASETFHAGDAIGMTAK